MLEIVYQDSWLVAINKPPGLLSHRSRIDVRANDFAVQRLRDQIGQHVYLVHRLDRPTSGVLLFALNEETARKTSYLFAERLIAKEYIAIVRGHPDDSICWNEPLQEKWDRVTDAKSRRDKLAQSATTIVRTLQRWELPYSTGKYPGSRYALVSLSPQTGRKHQLRRHLNHMAHPIVGDTTHGDRRHNRLFRERLGIHRLLLVANRIRMPHPETGNELHIEATAGPEFEHCIRQLNRFSVPECAPKTAT